MTKQRIDAAQLEDLLLQMMETELGGEKVYRTALTCAVNDDLKEEWTRYLEQTISHQNVVRALCEELNVDPDKESPTRSIVGFIGASLVKAMEMAKSSGNAQAAQILACECVVYAETKDHANWELLAKAAEGANKEMARTLLEAYAKVEKDEDHHLFHTQGWCRELAIQNLGLPAVLPPPEERKDVETAIGAARAEQARDQYI